MAATTADYAAFLAEFVALPENQEYFAAVIATELRERATVLRERFTTPHSKVVIAALSANGRWGYEKEGRNWTVIDKTGREPMIFESSLIAARRRTFDLDHPVHTVAPEPRPARFTIV